MIQITEDNYQQYIPLHPIAFSYGEVGAQGSPCDVTIVDKNKNIYYLDLLKLHQDIVKSIIPDLFELSGVQSADMPTLGYHYVYLGGGNHLMVCNSLFEEFNSIAPKINKYYGALYQEWRNIILYGSKLLDIRAALDYIGVDISDFALKNSMFTRPWHDRIHGIGHIYRTMIGCAMIAHLLQKPREGLLSFCGAYIHDLARETDDKEPEHGAMAVVKYFDKFNHLWDKYGLTEEERILVQKAVTQHSIREQMTPEDDGYDVMAILKDADALDRCRIGDLNPKWLRYEESRALIERIDDIYEESRWINNDMPFSDFVAKVVKYNNSKMKNDSTKPNKEYIKPQWNIHELVDYKTWFQKVAGKVVFGAELVDDSDTKISKPTQEDIKIATIMKTLNFETKLFRGFIIPGIIAEVVMILVIPILMSASIFGYIGGPAGVAVGMALLPIQTLFYAFLAVAAIYAIVLVRMRKRQNAKFVHTAREFLICGDVVISIIMLFSICLTIVGWDYFYEPSVIAILALGCAALAYFIIWTCKVYRHEGLRFWSKTTLKSIGKAIGFILLGIVAIVALFVLIMFLEDILGSRYPVVRR